MKAIEKLTLERVRAEKARRSLSEFMRQAWHVVEPATNFVPGWHLDAISEHLEAVSRCEIRNLLITMPPRHMKSLAVSVFWPAWEWISWPERRWMFSSYAASLSMRDSVKCRRLIESQWYQRHWGDRYQLVSDQNAKARFENDKTGLRIATSVGGAATGEGGDRIVCDDPHNIEEAESDTVRKSTIDWWDRVMSTRGNDPKTVAKIVVQQRVHQSDLAGHVLDRGGYEHLNLPAEFEGEKRATSIGWTDPRNEHDELLWPERFGRTEVDELKRRLGSYAAAGQLQQRPSPSGGGILKKHWWRYWRPRDVQLPPVLVQLLDGSLASIEAVPLPEKFDKQVQSWDCAFKDLKTSDFVCGQVWAALKADRFLLDYKKKRLDLPGTCAAIREMSANWPETHAKYVEDKANGPAVIQTLKQEIAGLIAVNPEGGKEARAAAVSPQIESGNVFLPHPSLYAWVNEFIESCAAFPNGKNDDDVDAATQAIFKLRKNPVLDFPAPVGIYKPSYWRAAGDSGPITLGSWRD